MEPARREIASGTVCDDVRALASLALDGPLGDDLGARLLQRHVGECAACARFVEEIGAATALLRSAPLEPFRCAPPGAARLGATTHRSHWATTTAAVVAVTLGVAWLPQSASPPTPGGPDGTARADAPVKLPIGQRLAESDFADSPPIELWA